LSKFRKLLTFFNAIWSRIAFRDIENDCHNAWVLVVYWG